VNAIQDYERRLAPARARLVGGRWVREILAPGVDADRLERFLIHFCALGARMTEPVEGWIRRAGERCRAVGLEALGDALIRHARAEAGHHLMMIADARTLAARRVLGGRSAIDVQALLASAPSVAIRRYAAVHEDAIAGVSPCAQLGIELEIEQMSRTRAWGRMLRGLAAPFAEFLDRAGPREVLDIGAGAGGPARLLAVG
jgi:hypothetical protein